MLMERKQSAGPLIKRIAYGIAIPGLLASGVIYLHTAAKYLFVRILRNSPHLQNGSWIHWSVWLSLTFGLAATSLILAESIPIFNYILSLTGQFGFLSPCCRKDSPREMYVV